jgi:hypothetical protein
MDTKTSSSGVGREINTEPFAADHTPNLGLPESDMSEPPSPVNARVLAWDPPINFLTKIAALPFTSEHIPRSIGAYPEAYSMQTGIDFGIALGATIATAAAALNDAFQLVADEATGYQQSARLWILTLAPSGSGKSPAHAHMLAPLQAIGRAALELHEKQAAIEKSRRKKGDDHGHDERLSRPRTIVHDTTIEAMSEVLKDTPRGVLIATDEIESWLGSMDAYRAKGGSRDRGEYLRMFDGGPHTIERIQRGSVHIPNWGCSILTATTPTVMHKLGKQLPEDGLMQRFITIVSPRQQDGVQVPGIDIERHKQEVLIGQLHNLAPLRNGKLYMTPEANLLFRAWRRENIREQEGFESIDPGLSAHVAKHPTLALRLALLFHCAEILSDESEVDRHPENCNVSEASMKLAIRFLKRSQSHALALYLAIKGESDVMDLARRAAKTILARKLLKFARRDLVQNGAFRGADPRRQDEALRLLEDLSWVRPARGRGEGSRPTHFDVNPAIQIKFSDLAEEETERRRRVREAIAESVADRRQDR